MKKSLFLTIALLLCLSDAALAWGKMGHDAVAYIAECNLSPRAKRTIEKYLEHSIVYYASWMDQYRTTPAYKHTTYWHTAPIDNNFYYTDAVRSSRGDVICELENAIRRLQDFKHLDDSTVVVNIKYIIHMVADMHCPVHVKYQDVKGYKIKINGTEYGYHSVWDEQILAMRHRWGYLEFARELDRCSKREQREITTGTPRQWMHENALNCRKIYDMATPGQVFTGAVTNDFLNAAQPLAERQIQKAGYRLARVLNELFG